MPLLIELYHMRKLKKSEKLREPPEGTSVNTKSIITSHHHLIIIAIFLKITSNLIPAGVIESKVKSYGCCRRCRPHQLQHSGGGEGGGEGGGGGGGGEGGGCE